ncbi:MAG TPA: GTPase ObgE [Spirochaetota bacterium]|nr:GTPase ObgE [Spirochaetota bacterium]
MSKFTDTITISVQAGHGGPGAVAFRREKYIPKGGPDGGDGGKGGDVFLEADRRYYNLSHLFKDRVYKAENGKQGMGDNRHGKDGGDLIIKVPPGTQILDDNENVIADLVEEGMRCLVATGGVGGRGNTFFKTSTHQTPRFAQPGMPGEEKFLVLNLKLIADIGLVGLPNAGKSTLLSRLTNARPKIADYPFTTLVPNLGVVERESGLVYTIADIPGIIEGAHMGHGLGLSFLQHIERVKVILYLIDVSEEDPAYNLGLLRSELETYSPGLVSKPGFIVLTKKDLVDEDGLQERAEQFHADNIIAVSAVSGDGLDRLTQILDEIMEKERAPQNPD